MRVKAGRVAWKGRAGRGAAGHGTVVLGKARQGLQQPTERQTEMKKNRTVAQVSEETIKIEQFLKGKPPGDTISYLEIEDGSGVKMDNDGKAKLRTAMKRLRFEYSPIHGYGIKLADASLVMPILGNRINRIDRAVKRGDKTQKNLQTQFFASLSQDEQRQVLFAGAVFGAIRVAAENGRMIYGTKVKSVTGGSVVVPVMVAGI